jgi:hypothetical protein
MKPPLKQSSLMMGRITIADRWWVLADVTGPAEYQTSIHSQFRHFGLYRFQDLGIRFGLYFAWFEAWTLFALLMRASHTRRAICSIAGIHLTTLVAFVVRDGIGSKDVAGVAEGILLLLRSNGDGRSVTSDGGREAYEVDLRISRAVCTADMAALLTVSAPAGEQCLAFVTCSPHALTRLFVHEVRAARLSRYCEDGRPDFVPPIDRNRRTVLLRLEQRGSLLTTGLFFRVASPRWLSQAFAATDMLAAGAFPESTESGLAFVTGPTDTHANGLLHAQCIAFHRMPLAWLDL